MTLTHYSVSQLRVAATCPRIHYFDAEQTRRQRLERPAITRIWTAGGESVPAGGALFHNVIEHFNRLAASAPEVQAAVQSSESPSELQQRLLRFINANCIQLEEFAKKPVALRQAFVRALHAYCEELALILNYGISEGEAPASVIEQLFSDRRKRVDVTFHVGKDDEVHVTGVLDYVFYDFRSGTNRIVEYKLTPGAHANKDLFQVCAYALMHHHQHGTEPAASVFYLHPARQIVEKKWAQVRAERHKVYDLLASMVAWGRYDERTAEGLKPPGDVTYCASCKWNKAGQCESRLGPKAEGGWDRRWEELASTRDTDPVIEARTPTEQDAEELEEEAASTSEKTGAQREPPPDDETSNVEDPPTRVDDDDSRVASSALALGQSSDNDPVLLDVSALNTHVAVVGAAGSGKTWMAKVIVEEAILAGVPVLAVDPQGDLVQFLSARSEVEVPPELVPRYRRYHARVETRVFTPGSSHGVRLCLDPIRLPSTEDLRNIPNQVRREEEETAMLSAVASNLIALARLGGETESQRTFVYRVLAGLPRKSTLGLKELVAAITEPEVAGIDEPDAIIKRAEREKLARKLNGFAIGPAAALFSGGIRLDLEGLLKPTLPGRVPLNVVYLNALTDDDQKQFFLASLAAEIYRWMITSVEGTPGRPTLLFYIDEARDFMPAGSRKPAAKEPLIRLFTQGRKYGVSCLLCTQSPRSVDYNVFGNTSTKIIGRMEAAQDVDRIGEWFAVNGPVPAWVSARKGAERGSFVARSPGLDKASEGRLFRSRPLFSLHEGAWSPDRVEREIDELDLRTRFQDGSG